MMNLPHFHSTGMLVFQFFLLASVAYRAQRFITTDSFPLFRWFRIKVREQFGTADESAVTDWLQCPWCIGFPITIAVFAWAGLLLNVPLVWLQAFAATSLVGLVGSRLD